MSTYNSRELRAFHRKRINWANVALGVAIPLSIAIVTGAWTVARTAWNDKATVAAVNAKADTLSVNAIKAQLTRIETKTDDAVLRLRQMKCGKAIDTGCR